MSIPVLCLAAVLAAPAPFPQKVRSVEAVLVTGTAARARAVVRLVRSRAFLNGVLRETRDRLKVEVLHGGKLVRLRLLYHREADRTAILTAVVDKVTRKPPAFMTPRQKQAWMENKDALIAFFVEADRALKAMRQQGVGVTKEDIARAEATAADYEVKAHPPTLHVPPRRGQTKR
jgi:hypothetical protein